MGKYISEKVMLDIVKQQDNLITLYRERLGVLAVVHIDSGGNGRQPIMDILQPSGMGLFINRKI